MYRVFVKPPRELTLLRNVTLGWPHGTLSDETGKLVLSQMDEQLAWIPGYYTRMIAAGSTLQHEFKVRAAGLTELALAEHRSRSSLEVLDPAVNHIYMVHPFGYLAFGHLFDSLQRLRHAIGTVPEPFRVIHSDASRIVGFESHMRMLGIRPEQLLSLGASVVVPRLWISPWQTFPAGLTPESFEWIYERYTAGLHVERRTRLYLSRNHVRPGARGVTNESEVVELLARHGFVVLRGDEPLEDIVRLFHGAKAIVGPHGSLFANTMFCTEDCQVLEFCPANRIDISFKTKLKRVRDYFHLATPADEQHNIAMPLDVLRLFLERIEHPGPGPEAAFRAAVDRGQAPCASGAAPRKLPPIEDGTIAVAGIKVAVDPAVISEVILWALAKGQYENAQSRIGRVLLEAEPARGNRSILEIGAGLGFLGASLFATGKVARLTSYEANPALLPLLERTHRLNGVVGSLHAAMVVGGARERATLHVPAHFWSASERPLDDAQRIVCPCVALHHAVESAQPDMLVVNIEGGEDDLFGRIESLNGIEQVLISVHQRIIGRDGMRRLFADMVRLGFAYDARFSAGKVLVFQRLDVPL